VAVTGEGPTHYEVLGVATDVEPGELRRAWVAAARRNHPDVAGEDPTARADAERRMQRINEAWSVVGDPERRRAYDRQLQQARWQGWQQGMPTPEFVPFDDSAEPDDPAAEFDVPYGDGTPMPRSLQTGPLLIVLLGVVALALGAVLGFGPLLALGVTGLVAGGLAFLAAPVYAVFRGHRNGMD
jgi:curved DNA-binding protein CbpA